VGAHARASWCAGVWVFEGVCEKVCMCVRVSDRERVCVSEVES
jgi:hypothetical protein